MALDNLKDIHYRKEGHVAIATLDRPERRNAQSNGMTEGIISIVHEVEDDDDVRCLVLTAADPWFCPGADAVNMASRARGADERGAPMKRIAYGRMGNDFGPTLYNCARPTIGAINGMTAGGGLSIAMACDIRIASENARFCCVFVRRALVPDVTATFTLPRLVGWENACRMAFTGDIIDAKEALRIGLVSQVVPHDQLLPAAMELANKIAAGPPITIEMTKKLMKLGMANNHVESQVVMELGMQRVMNATEDHKEGSLSFAEKRAPVFQGR